MGGRESVKYNIKSSLSPKIPFETVLENLQILCEKCNIGKSDVELEDIG